MRLVHLYTAAIVATALLAAPAPAVQLDTQGTNKAPAGNVAYRDTDGTWRVVATGTRSAAADTRSAATPGTSEQIPGNNGFQVTYRDLELDNGIGFDHPEFGSQRRDVLAQVLADIDALIDDTGTLEIEVQASQMDGSGSLASASTFFPTAPNGIHPGAAFKHLTTGQDPFAGVPDMVLQLDFGYNFNHSLDLPASDQVDLYTILIHELIHGLGLVSLSDSNGASLVSGGTPGVFSAFDRLLYTGSGMRLWSAQGAFRGLGSDLAGDDAGVEFRGANASAEFGGPVPLHAPSPYAHGSSLVHWHSTAATNRAVMQQSFSLGEVHRTPLAYELGALADLGYNVQLSGDGDDALDFAVIEGSWLNPQTAGEGIFLDHGPSLDMLFAAWFTFTMTPGAVDDPGANVGDADQRWLTALLEFDPATGTATGTLMSRHGGEFDAPPRSGEGNDPVGTISINFSACDQAHVEYTLDTINVSGGFDIEPLERQVNPEGFTCRSQQ